MTSPNRHTVKGDTPMFPEDTTILKQVNETHAPDGRDVNAMSILDIVEGLLRRAPLIRLPESDSMVEKIRDAVVDGDGTAEALAFIIQNVSREITFKCRVADAHGTTMSVLQILSNYSWDAKVVITLAALAINYAEFLLVAQLYMTHPLAKSVAVLKQLPDLNEPSSALKSRFDALTSLINAMVDVTKGVIEFCQIPSSPMSMTNVPTASYWTIRSAVACVSQISSFTGMSLDDVSSKRTTTESLELSSMVLKERDIHDHLMQQLYQIDEKKHADAFDYLVRLFDLPQHDNIRILKHLIFPKDDIQPLYKGSTKERDDIDALKRKTVLLMISDLDVSHEEISSLDILYSKSRSMPGSDYEIVWIPIVDADHSINWNEEHQQKFEKLQSMMLWYTIHNPKLLDPAAMRYIKEVWRFQKRMVLVVLDPYGKVVSQNALHMMLIWGHNAYPFTAMKELSLWREATWSYKLLMGIHELNRTTPTILIGVFGGTDMDWIRRFTTTIKQIAHLAEMPIELAYVGKGKSNAEEWIEKITETIAKEQLSEYWTPIAYWYFWKRLECMLYSLMKLGNMDMERDRVMQELMRVLSYDESDQGWAIIWKGDEMARAKGDIMLQSLNSFKEWKENARINGFVPALREHLLKLQTPHHCTRITFPRVQGGIAAKVVCAECGRPMETYLMYRCCPKKIQG